MKYLTLNTQGQVTNVIVWDGQEPYTPDNDCTLIPITNAPTGVGIGWTFSNGEWIAPFIETPDEETTS